MSQHPTGAPDDATVRAVGLVTEALEMTERARGHLYTFHQLTGRADFKLGEAVDALREAGHGRFADELSEHMVGRNVITGRWTYQLVEEYDDGYWSVFRQHEAAVREALTGGERHRYEAALKEARRTPGHPAHTAEPGTGQ